FPRSPHYDGSGSWSARRCLGPGVGDLNHKQRRSIQPSLNVTGDSYYYAQLQRSPFRQALLPHGILVWPKPPRQALRHNDFSSAAIMIVEPTSRKNWNTHRLKIIRTHGAIVDNGRPLRWELVSRQINAAYRALSLQRQHACPRRRADARQGLDSIQGSAVERLALGSLRVSYRRQVNISGEHVFNAEAGIELEQVQQAAAEQTGDDQQHRAHPNFGADEYSAQFAGAAVLRDALPGATECFVQVGFRDQPGGQRSE